jgi:ribosomal protein S18 acetylase RimI-like enzyme
MPDADRVQRPAPDRSDIGAIRRSNFPVAVSGAARAFEENPSMRWTFRDDSVRHRRLERGFSFYFDRIWLERGECYTVNGVPSAAVWSPPGRWRLPISLQLRLLPGIVRFARGDAARLLRFLSIIERKHPHDEHWYLQLLAVDPDFQGRGFGSHLMGPVLDCCDRDRMPAYLETDTERNVILYRRHGFEVSEEFRLDGDGPTVWLMWREPA